MPRRLSLLLTVLTLLTLLDCSPISSARGQEKTPATGAALPQVFLIGDSISLGYTGPVTKLLADKAIVTRPNTNCQHTGVGLKSLEKWLAGKKFDVIHFNWGIWDTHYLSNATNGLVPTATPVDPKTMHLRHTPEEYAANLRQLVKIMQGTGAKLIFASTTPIWKSGTERYDNIAKFNAAALQVMEEEGVAIDDLYTFVLDHRTEWQGNDLVHFNAMGNAQLGKQVSESILQAIEKPATVKP